MRRRFVIGVGELDQDQERRFREYLAKLGPWWHWIGNIWLLTTTKDGTTAADLRDKLSELNASARVIVFEFPEDLDWATTGTKNAHGRGIEEWILSPWGDRDPEP